MSKSSNIAIWIALALPLLTAPLWADGIVNGGGSSSTIATACGGVTTSSVFFSKGGLCSGDTNFTYSGGGTTLNLGQAGSLVQFEMYGTAAGGGTNRSIYMFDNGTPFINVGHSGVFGLSSNDPGTPDAGFSRSGAASIVVGNGNAGDASGGLRMALLTTTASVTHQNLVTGTNADFLCLAANGQILIQTTACTISSLRFKPDWVSYTDNALAKVVNMEVGTFHTDIPNNDPNWQTQQAGLNAENIAKIAPECAVYEDDMKTPKSYRQECVIALLVKSLQELKSKIH